MVYLKTLLLDFSNIAYATYYVMLGKEGQDIKGNDEKFNYWRFLMLSMIKNIKIKHQPFELFICADSFSWRKKAFEYYKANRDNLKKDHDFDYQYFIENMKLFIKELEENFPYKVIQCNGAEADDIIAVLATELSPVRDSIIIASNDKDFKQLVKGNISLYNIKEKEFVNVDDPKHELISLILSGDKNDGIPNVLSDDDVFVDSGKRQRPCGPKKIGKILEEGIKEFCEREGVTRNFARNRKLIELSKGYIPPKLWDFIINKANNIEAKKIPYGNLLKYFRAHNLRTFLSEIDLFLLN